MTLEAKDLAQTLLNDFAHRHPADSKWRGVVAKPNEFLQGMFGVFAETIRNHLQVECHIYPQFARGNKISGVQVTVDGKTLGEHPIYLKHIGQELRIGGYSKTLFFDRLDSGIRLAEVFATRVAEAALSKPRRYIVQARPS